MTYSVVIVLSWQFLLLYSERESQLRATQEEAQKQFDKAWAQVKELQQRENQLKVRSVCREDDNVLSVMSVMAAHKWFSFFLRVS